MGRAETIAETDGTHRPALRVRAGSARPPGRDGASFSKGERVTHACEVPASRDGIGQKKGSVRAEFCKICASNTARAMTSRSGDDEVYRNNTRETF